MALLIVAKRRKQSKCQSKDKWINKIGYILTVKIYSSIKKKNQNTEIRHNTDELGDIILIEVSPIHKRPHTI